MRIWQVFALLAAGLIVGCSSDSGANAAAASPTDKPVTGGESEFKVALLTPGPVSDNGWNKMAYDALQSIKTDLNATVDNQEATGAKVRDAMRSYAQKKYNLILGHGFEYNDPELEISKDFPDTVFVSSSGGKFSANAGAFRFYLEQGCYLEGYLAGKLSKTGKIGAVAVLDIPSINSTLKAFEAGAKAANPKITILPTLYFGADGDIAKAKQATEQLIGQGADFVIHQANAGAKGVFDACAAKGVYALGTNLDQNDDPSGAVMASSIIKAGPAFLDLSKRVKDKTYKGEVSLYGMDKDAIDFVINPKMLAKVPAPLQKELADLKENIKAGKVIVPKIEF